MSEYTQGFCQDGAAILRDGQPMTIEEVLEGLRYADALAAHVDDLHRSINDLIGDSVGVAGLHQNGDVAEWGDLLEGGHFEGWLLALGDKPDISCLARLKEAWKFDVLNELADKKKAEWQAEVIDRLLHEDMNSGADGDMLPARMWKLANKLRQAEEAQ